MDNTPFPRPDSWTEEDEEDLWRWRHFGEIPRTPDGFMKAYILLIDAAEREMRRKAHRQASPAEDRDQGL